MDDERPVAWTAMPPHVPVFGADGRSIGTTETVLGDEAADIFHGVVVRRDTDGRLVKIPGDDVEQITTERVRADLTPADVDRLPEYEEEPGPIEGLVRKVTDKLDTTT